jgi:hypothetical protein
MKIYIEKTERIQSVDSSRGCLESMSKSKLFGSLIASKYTIG